MKNTIIRLTAIIALAATCASGAAAFATAKTAVQANTVSVTLEENKASNKASTATTEKKADEKTDEVKTVRVSYDTGLVKAKVPNAINVVPGKPYRDLQAPGYAAGYTFDGWYLNGVKVSNTTKVFVSSDHVLTAKWKSNRTGKIVESI